MFDIIVIIAIIAAILLGLVILIQNPKGGGLSGTFGGTANQIFGYKRSTDDVEKITWGLVIIVFAMSLSTAAIKPSVKNDQPSVGGLEAKPPAQNMQLPPTENNAGEETPIVGDTAK